MSYKSLVADMIYEVRFTRYDLRGTIYEV